MFNVIFYGRNFFLKQGVNEIANALSQTAISRECPAANKHYIISLDDSNVLKCLINIASGNLFKKEDCLLILSNLVSESLARRFINVDCLMICLPQKMALQELTACCLHAEERIEEKIAGRDKHLNNKEKKLLLGLKNGDSVRALAKKFSLPEKMISARKVCIMKKLDISRSLQLLQIINSHYLIQALAFL